MTRIFIEVEISDAIDPGHALELVNAALDNGYLQRAINEDCNCDACVALREDEDADAPVVSTVAVGPDGVRRAVATCTCDHDTSSHLSEGCMAPADDDVPDGEICDCLWNGEGDRSDESDHVARCAECGDDVPFNDSGHPLPHMRPTGGSCSGGDEP